MSIHPPPKDWFQAPAGGERIWIGMALVWCLVLFLMMPYWHLYGKQNSTGQAFRIEPEAFKAKVDTFVEAHKVGELKTIPVCQPSPGEDAWLQASQFMFYPVLKLKKGQTYRLHLSSLDVQHGFSLYPLNMNFQILPGYDHVLTITPTRSGEYTVVCNEFCGIGHHTMTGKIIVEE